MAVLSDIELASAGSLKLYEDRVVQVGRKSYKSALLSQVDFCAASHRSYISLLVLGVIGLLGGAGLYVYQNGGEAALMVGGIGLVMIILFLLTRFSTITIRVGDGSMRAFVRSANLAKVKTFITQVEAAKIDYELKCRMNAIIASDTIASGTVVSGAVGSGMPQFLPQ